MRKAGISWSRLAEITAVQHTTLFARNFKNNEDVNENEESNHPSNAGSLWIMSLHRNISLSHCHWRVPRYAISTSLLSFALRVLSENNSLYSRFHRLWSNRVKNENGFFAINRTHNFLFGTSVPSPVELKLWGKIFAQTEKRASCNAYEWGVLNPRSPPLRSMSPNMRRRNRRSVALPMSAD